MVNIKEDYLYGLYIYIYFFFDKTIAGSGIKSMPQNEQLTEELHKPIIRKFKKKKSVFSIQRQYSGC